MFHGGAEAWTFAKAIQDRADASGVPIRIGITTGQVVALEGLPVGRGVFEADAISALPPKGGIAASMVFWNETLRPDDRRGWEDLPCESDPEVVFLRPIEPNRVPPSGGKDSSGGDGSGPRKPASGPELKPGDPPPGGVHPGWGDHAETSQKRTREQVESSLRRLRDDVLVDIAGEVRGKNDPALEPGDPPIPYILERLIVPQRFKTISGLAQSHRRLCERDDSEQENLVYEIIQEWRR